MLLAVLLISSVSLSPLYLILLLIRYPLTSSKTCSVISVSKPILNRANSKTDTKTEKGERKYNKNTIFNTVPLHRATALFLVSVEIDDALQRRNICQHRDDDDGPVDPVQQRKDDKCYGHLGPAEDADPL